MHISNVLCHKHGNLLSNAGHMRPIGEIRQLRLQQFVAQTGLSYADINGALGRNRRDATLNQIAKAAANTSTGKPRRMGDTQARMLEDKFELPAGWFDTDPDLSPDFLARLPTGKLVVRRSPLTHPATVVVAREEVVAPYHAGGSWPFARVRREAIEALAPETRDALERVILAFLGEPAVPDWRPVAYDTAAQLDAETRGENFTLFVRAIEDKLGMAPAKPRAKDTRDVQR